jgi:anion-transporting  ArsA/GET3 family ATPase
MTGLKNEALDTILREREVVICCGSGGVGKTTTSAALALRAAMLGRKAVVCTIDPARRLASSMGITELGNEVIQVERERFEALGIEPEGTLYAMMLDTKRTFDKLIGRYAKSEEARERIFANKFYQQMSSTVVGSSDYMAMEKLFELHESGDYDLIVLDTPPTKHALDFLQAPSRMSEAFDEGTLSVFLKPWADAGKKSLGFIGRAMNRVVNKVDQVLGLQFVSDFAEFFKAFDGMYEGFRGRAQNVDQLLRESFTSFLVVTSPNPLALQEASYFCERLREFQMPLGGVIVNRVTPSGLTDAAVRDDLQRRLHTDGPSKVVDTALAGVKDVPELLRPVLRAFADRELQAAGDRSRIQALKEGPAKGVHVAEVPQLSTDVYDLTGLKKIADCLFEESSP